MVDFVKQILGDDLFDYCGYIAYN